MKLIYRQRLKLLKNSILYSTITTMAKIVYDDGREETFNQEDFISRADLEENYLSKEDVEENYVTREKYNQKKQQAKSAFADKDKAKQEALATESERLRNELRDEIRFTTKHGFDDIPEEVKQAKEKHPTLSWDEAMSVSGYKPATIENPNPGRANPNVFNPEKKEYTLEELAKLPQEQYNLVAAQIEKGEIKRVLSGE